MVMSMTRHLSRVTLPPVRFWTFLRISNVPKVELFAGSEVKSLTRFGGEAAVTHGSKLKTAKLALRWMGDDRFSGPGAPNRCPAPADVPFVSTKIKSAALLFVSFGVLIGQAPNVVMEPLLPQLSR